MIPTVAVFCRVMPPLFPVRVTCPVSYKSWMNIAFLPKIMSFPYNTGDGSGSAFPQWETLQHSPLDTPVPTPSSGTYMDPMDLNLDDPQQQQQSLDDLTPTIDNTPILLHHPSENPQIQQRHRPRARSGTGTPSIHPIDALIFSRPGSASSTGGRIHPMGMSQLITHSQQFAPPSDPTHRSIPTPSSTPNPSSSKKTGPVRTTRTRTATPSSHPYLHQPQAQSSSPFAGVSIAPTSGPSMMTRSKVKQSVKFADTTATTSTRPGMGPMTHHGHGGMVERPVTRASSSPGGGEMQSSPRTAPEFFGTTVTAECVAPSSLK